MGIFDRFRNVNEEPKVIKTETVGGRFHMKIELVTKSKDNFTSVSGKLDGGPLRSSDIVCIASDAHMIKGLKIQSMEIESNGELAQSCLAIPGDHIVIKLKEVKISDIAVGDILVNYDVK